MPERGPLGKQRSGKSGQVFIFHLSKRLSSGIMRFSHVMVAAAVGLPREGAIRVEGLATQRFSLDEFEKAIALAGKPGESVKIQIVP